MSLELKLGFIHFTSPSTLGHNKNKEKININKYLKEVLMKQGNLNNRECYNETCDWDLDGIIDYIEKVFEAAPEIGLDSIIYRTWEKAGADFYWHSYFDHRRKTAKFHQISSTPLEHIEVLECGCSKSTKYSNAIYKFEGQEDSEESSCSKNHTKIRSSLKKYFGEYAIAITYGVKNPYYGIKRDTFDFMPLDENSKLGKKLNKASEEERKLMNSLRKMSDAAGVGVYQREE